MKTILFSVRGILVVLSITLSRQSSIAAGVVASATESALRSALVGGGLVTFNVSGTIVLINSITLTSDTTIDGSGQSVAISGGNAVRVFLVNTNVQFSLLNLTLANGRTNQGAGIYNDGGSVLISGCNILTNQAFGANGVDGPGGTTGQPSFGGAAYNAGSMTLLNSTFFGNAAVGGTGGSSGLTFGASGANGNGGVIYNTGLLAMTNCVFSGNGAAGGNGGSGSINSGGQPGAPGSAFGGVLYSQTTTVTVSNCSFTANAANGGTAPLGPPSFRAGVWRGTGRGGAFYNPTGNLQIRASSFTQNSVVGSPASGGSIHQGTGSMSLSNVTVLFSSTVADKATAGITAPGTAGNGGGVFNAGAATLTDCYLASNSVSGGLGVSGSGSGSSAGGDAKGGGIYNSGTLGLLRCTLAGNTATGGNGAGFSSGGGGYGGGFVNEGTQTWMVNCTVSFNTTTGGTGTAGSTSFGGGICYGIAATNCTVYGNNTVGGNGGNLGSFGGSTIVNTIIAQGLPNNIAGGITSVQNIVSVGNPRLGPLGNYGGPTLTMPLLNGSPALNVANNASAPATDQRGRSRPDGGNSDIGAFESSPPYVVVGHFIGLSPSDSVSITLESQTTNVVSGSSFRFDSVATGGHMILVSNFNLTVVPNPLLLNLGPDMFDADFVAYSANTLLPLGVSNGVSHVMYAGTNAQTHRVQASSNLVDWIAIATNTIGPVLYSEVWDVNAVGQPARFYRSVSP